jgi:hypothetical protein
MVAFEEDVFWIMNLGCAILAMFTVIRWRGDARTTLLLKLVEEREKEDSQPGASPNGGPAMPPANSGVTKGPPSVS